MDNRVRPMTADIDPSEPQASPRSGRIAARTHDLAHLVHDARLGQPVGAFVFTAGGHCDV